MLVMKFGGTLMGSAQAITHSASLVGRSLDAGERVVAVVSAMSGVTDQLLKIAASAQGGDIAFANDEIALLRSRHFGAAQGLGAAPDHAAVREVRELLETLRQTVYGVFLLRELSTRTRDLIVSFGERMSAPLMALALSNLGVRPHHLTGGQAGIITDTHFGSARPLPEAYQRIRDRLGGLLEAGVTPVVAGFMGETVDGVITTLGRGGTDYSATIVGSALRAEEVWAWKDVDGVMTADPRVVKDARNISHLSYPEVMELAYFGGKVLHPLAVTPLIEHGIPLRVKSAADPSFAGTLVDARGSVDDGHPIKAVTAIRGVSIIGVSGAGLVGIPEVIATIFSTLAQEAVSVLMIAQGSSMANVTLAVLRADAERALAALRRALERSADIREISLTEGVSLVAVVGEGMRGTRGVAGRVFGAMAEADVNILMISQGSSELNISFAVHDVEADEAVRATHRAFGLDVERAEA